MPNTLPELIDDEEARHLHRWGWRLQPWLRGLVMAFAAAGASGLTGLGPLANSEVKSVKGGITLSHAKITHLELENQLRVRIAANTDTVTLWLSHAFIENHTHIDWSPAPTSTQLGKSGDRLMFVLAEGVGHVVLNARPVTVGQSRYKISLPGDTLSFTEIILP